MGQLNIPKIHYYGAMRLSNKLVEEVVEEVAGEDVVPLIKVLKDKKNVSEFKLAENIKQEVNRVRNMLYRLHDANLVSFVRKKDKKKGWYIYYWTFNNARVKYLATSLKMKRISMLKERLEREKEGQFYTCTANKCIRLDFDQAMNFEFKCPECGNLIDQEDNSTYIKKIEDEIKEIELELKEAPAKKKPSLKKLQKKATRKRPMRKSARKSKIKAIKRKSGKKVSRKHPKQKTRKRH